MAILSGDGTESPRRDDVNDGIALLRRARITVKAPCRCDGPGPHLSVGEMSPSLNGWQSEANWLHAHSSVRDSRCSTLIGSVLGEPWLASGEVPPAIAAPRPATGVDAAKAAAPTGENAEWTPIGGGGGAPGSSGCSSSSKTPSSGALRGPESLLLVESDATWTADADGDEIQVTRDKYR